MRKNIIQERVIIKRPLDSGECAHCGSFDYRTIYDNDYKDYLCPYCIEDLNDDWYIYEKERYSIQK